MSLIISTLEYKEIDTKKDFSFEINVKFKNTLEIGVRSCTLKSSKYYKEQKKAGCRKQLTEFAIKDLIKRVTEENCKSTSCNI